MFPLAIYLLAGFDLGHVSQARGWWFGSYSGIHGRRRSEPASMVSLTFRLGGHCLCKQTSGSPSVTSKFSKQEIVSVLEANEIILNRGE